MISAAFELDERRLRDILGHYPTGVVVVATTVGGTPVGMSIGSFTSVSLAPPLVGFLPARRSQTWPAIRAAGRLCVSVLGAGQEHICATMAGPRDERFTHVAWTPGPDGCPRIDGALAWFDCLFDRQLHAGDHWFVTARVRAATTSGESTAPLIFHRGAYGAPAA